ncbi:tRNA (guanosine(37)-N1)-methyltransferase TrmD [Candidatus Endomicrobiellum trichonymphae]|uniref:tRNA (guanine-N(1)-)-methyltransferase n=1 Tax=Endomicrobium trichonymphae TaxID=1408204 RepID=TRMD_ENDTX|nr:tRNA (guanosine(37)-N1)-methyltransferase TrmD [Candidatus Endomicrobium trichonymphae]B1GZ20.1 RecName: Full=tRNA (guanine-N(1)-)-methyltransferase; AltName: Full=M1G-methyltransferase; AltName: Full=tRNA [GM37] methyltransferase [Candidatus Endomicrobium trichonymphae]BAG13502.1 tRNA (guanine-N1-)-methyltransferase [Candidatus Endomicrobium trichonymphae]
MKIDVLTIFPGMFKGPLTESLIGKAIEKEILKINIIDIRSFSKDKHKKVDDKSFGGGCGMVMKLEPLYDAIKSTGVKKKNSTYKNPYTKPYVIYMSPQGRILSDSIVKNLAKFKQLVIICGHYEGVDERTMNYVDEEISIGDYILTGGEIPAMVLIDSTARMLTGVVKEKSSVKNDSFYNNLLDYPHYTRPAVFKGYKIPEVLLSGDHKKISEWRVQESYKRTKERRPDLLKK